jgi:hypothetical protein
MAEYRIRYVVGHDTRGRPDYHSVTVSSEEPPTEDEALAAAFLQENHLYEEGAEDIEVDDIRELAPLPVIGPARARFVFDYDTGEWIGPLFEGPAHRSRL